MFDHFLVFIADKPHPWLIIRFITEIFSKKEAAHPPEFMVYNRKTGNKANVQQRFCLSLKLEASLMNDG